MAPGARVSGHASAHSEEASGARGAQVTDWGAQSGTAQGDHPLG